MHTHTHTHKHKHMHVYMHAHIHAHALMPMHAQMSVCDFLFLPAVCNTIQNTCSSNAQCSVGNSGNVVCTCNTNYQGNGQTCTRRSLLLYEV